MMPWWRPAPYDGDMEQGLRRFAVVMTFISLFFRFFVLIAFWKASVDYYTIIGPYLRFEDGEGGVRGGQEQGVRADLGPKAGYYRRERYEDEYY